MIRLTTVADSKPHELTLRRFTLKEPNNVVSVDHNGTVVFGLARADLRAVYNQRIKDVLCAIATRLGRTIVTTCLLNRDLDPEPVLRNTADLAALCFPVISKGGRDFTVLPVQLLPIVLIHLHEYKDCSSNAGVLDFATYLEDAVDEGSTDNFEALRACVDIKSFANTVSQWSPLADTGPETESDGDSDDGVADQVELHYSQLRRRDAQAIIGDMLLKDRREMRIVCTSAYPQARLLMHKAGALPGWSIELEVEEDADASARVKRRRVARSSSSSDNKK